MVVTSLLTAYRASCHKGAAFTIIRPQISWPSNKREDPATLHCLFGRDASRRAFSTVSHRESEIPGEQSREHRQVTYIFR